MFMLSFKIIVCDNYVIAYEDEIATLLCHSDRLCCSFSGHFFADDVVV